MYYYVISFALSTPMAIGLIVSLIFRAYIIISFIYYVCIIAPALISHPFTNMHQKIILIIIYFQNRWSHDSIVEPTYVLMGSPGHYQLITIFLKLSFFSSHILHDICLNKLFVIVRWSCDIDMYACFYMVSVTITLEIFKLQYYVYYALFDSLYKLLLYLSYKCYV